MKIKLKPRWTIRIMTPDDEKWSFVGPARSQDIKFQSLNPSRELMKICDNGDIYVKGRLLVTDEEIAEGLRKLVRGEVYGVDRVDREQVEAWFRKTLESGLVYGPDFEIEWDELPAALDELFGSAKTLTP